MTVIPATRKFKDRRWPEDLAAAKVLFMTEVTYIIGDGRGGITRLESGILEFRPATGEIYHLGERSMTRIARLFKALYGSRTSCRTTMVIGPDDGHQRPLFQ